MRSSILPRLGGKGMVRTTCKVDVGVDKKMKMIPPL
jgi:hypothetical protein